MIDSIPLRVEAFRQDGHWCLVVRGPEWTVNDIQKEIRGRGGVHMANYGGTLEHTSFMLMSNYTEEELERFAQNSKGTGV